MKTLLVVLILTAVLVFLAGKAIDAGQANNAATLNRIGGK